MESEIELEGLSVSARVFDSIVRIAAEKVEGVAYVGIPAGVNSMLTSFLSEKRPLQMPAVGVRSVNGELQVAVHVTAFFGYPFRALADDVRAAVSASISGIVGIDVSSVDVFIDALVFPKE